MNRQIVRLREWGFLTCLLSYSLLLLLMPMTAAGQTGFGTVKIVVTGPGGTPIANADLCLAMPGQSVRRMTDSTGSYTTTLPVGETTIRLSRDGYTNAQDTVSMTNGANLVRQIILQPGQSTPLPSDCGIPATAVPGNSCDVITGIRVVSGTTTTNPTVTIQVDFSTWPHAYRVTEFSREESYRDNFNPEDGFRQNNVPWLRAPQTARNGLTISYPLTESYYGTHSIYVQTQRHQNGCVSQPRVVTVVLAPGNYQTHTLKGTELQQFIAEATARGYEFRTSFSARDYSKRSLELCGDPGFLQLRNYNDAKRFSDELWEEVDATFEAFTGSLLFKPYWSIERSAAYHPSLPPTIGYSQADPKRETMAVVFERYAQGSCPNGCQQSPKRVFSWKRKTYHTMILSGTENQGGNAYCELKGEKQAYLTELVLRGPMGQNPIDALEDLRTIRPAQLRLVPPPRVIIPRGIDEKDATEGFEQEAPQPEPEEQP